MTNHNDETIHLKWDHYGSLHRFNLRQSEWQFSKLLEKIRTIQPLFKDTLGYIDEDGDCCLFSSTMEMDELLELSKARNEKTIRIKSIGKGKDEADEEPKTETKTEKEKEIHPNIMCDLCDKFIAGIRYKCTICDDYDLCEDCEKTGIHPEHPMLRLANPRTPKGPFEMKRRWMRGSRCGGRMGQQQASNRCPFQPNVVQEAVQNAMRKSATFPTPNAEAPTKEGDANQQPEEKGAEFLKDVGTMLQSVLSNFGIDVDMSIEHNDKREKLPKTEEKPSVLEKASELQAPPVPPRVPTAPMAPMAPRHHAPRPPKTRLYPHLPPVSYPPNPIFPFGLAAAVPLKKAEELKAPKGHKSPFQPETLKQAVQNVMKPKEMEKVEAKVEESTPKTAQDFADQTARDTLEEAIEAVTKDALKKSEEVLDFAVNTVNNIKDNPQTKEDMEKFMKNAAEATQFAINQATEMVKRNSSYMATNAENPQFRNFMSSVSQWADKMAEFYPGIIPAKDVPEGEKKTENETPKLEEEEKKLPEVPTHQLYTDMPILVPEKNETATKPPTDIMSMSNSSLATALEIDDDIPIINKEMFYKDVIEHNKDNASIGTNTTGSEKKSAETQYYSDDSDVEIITGSLPGSPANGTSAQATKETSPYPPEPIFKEDDGWNMINNADYEAMCKFYEAKRQAEEQRRKELEEQIETQRREHTRMLLEKAALKTEQEQAAKNVFVTATAPLYPTLDREEDCSAGIPYPTMPSTVRPHSKICFFKHPEAIVQNAVECIEGMGYDNCNGWITRLAEKYQGDISTILDEAAKDPLHLARLD